ncbi:CDP-alcohol phosphatidyltransferase family protein [Candidatus Woesearchaeota archaeon]|nr:CDP-alcohol phosphatidyltransferase family protein [Candidatus Woesearchaeota archaeon]
MDKWLQTSLEKFRIYRSEKFLPVGKFFLKYQITANLMTCLSFLAGLGAVYFLFQNHLYFILLGLLHLTLDGIDGIIARASAPTLFGKYLDHFSDQMIGLLLILKIAFTNNDYFIYIIAALVFFSQLFYSLSKMKAPAFFPRTSLTILLLFNQVTLAFLVAGIIGLYSLAMQLIWAMQKSRGP